MSKLQSGRSYFVAISVFKKYKLGTQFKLDNILNWFYARSLYHLNWFKIPLVYKFWKQDAAIVRYKKSTSMREGCGEIQVVIKWSAQTHQMYNIHISYSVDKEENCLSNNVRKLMKCIGKKLSIINTFY